MIRVPGALELWDEMVCPECSTRLQLINVRPPEVDYADYDDDYDDDDYDDYDDDYDDDDYDDDY
jgi:hypothetical protein